MYMLLTQQVGVRIHVTPSNAKPGVHAEQLLGKEQVEHSGGHSYKITISEMRFVRI